MRTFFKHDMEPLGVQRRRKKADLKAREQRTMETVRKRDAGCRFPLCGCRRRGIRLEVAHDEHRGIGGNPAGDRTDTSTMVQVCAWRHKEGIFSLDKKTLRWVPMSTLGANGSIQWQVDMALVDYIRGGRHGTRPTEPRWMQVAIETPGRSRSAVMVMSDLQRDILGWLAKMDV